VFWRLAQLAYGLLLILGLLAVNALCLYAIWWAVMSLVSLIPVVGKRHKHDRWEQFNNASARRPSGRTPHLDKSESTRAPRQAADDVAVQRGTPAAATGNGDPSR
jgi:hypothetical protein